jgi:hypothetical protein
MFLPILRPNPLLLPHTPVIVAEVRQRTCPYEFRNIVYSSMRVRLSAVPRRGLPWPALSVLQ